MKFRNLISLLGIALFIFILIKIDFSKVLTEVEGAKMSLLLLSVAMVFVSMIFQTLKWHAIARKQKIKIKFLDSFKINFISFFYGFITPGRIGALMRAEYIKDYGGGGKGVSNYIIDKMLDLFSVIFLGVIFSFLILHSFISNQYLWWGMYIFLLIILLFLLIFIDMKRSKFFLYIFYNRLVPEKMKGKFKEKFYAFYEDMPKKRYLPFFFVLNLSTWIIIYLQTYLVGSALGIELSFMYYLAILPIGTIISLIPISVNGLGTREAVLISIFGIFGVEAAKVFSMSIVNIFISGLLPCIIGIFLILKHKKN